MKGIACKLVLHSPLPQWWCHQHSCRFPCIFKHCLLQLSLGWSPSVFGRQTSEGPKLCSPSCSPYTSIFSHHSITQTQPMFARLGSNFLKIACLCFNAINSSIPAYLSDLLQFTLLLHLFAPVPKSASSKSLSKSVRRKLSCFFLIWSFWKSLPLHIKNATTFQTINSTLKAFSFRKHPSMKLT